ncbi:S-adenosylmethionine mitochondrial carrier protein-like isoform X1 [Zingiber officinale]|nr:S-adenosylmethionine mitochondrial carrier protein-like isoform X1 [Zingiber officinale]XP_042418423.1 S-adenosylmethionine mitochondrial carrier protein-like isoform X1 [Zingiber officinale]
MGLDFFRDNTFLVHVVASTSSVSVATSLTHPLDSLKTLLQIAAGPSQQFSLSQVVDRVQKVSGLSGLYSGLGWSIVGNLLGLGGRFGTYEILTAYYKDGRKSSHVYIHEALLAGLTAGAVEAVVCTPFELLKHRRQVYSASYIKSSGSAVVMPKSSTLVSKLLPGYTPNVNSWNYTIGLLSTLPTNINTTHGDMLGALKQCPWLLTGSGRPPLASEVREPSKIVSLEGWNALWKGLRPAITQKCVYGGFFFSTWQFLYLAMLDWNSRDMNPPPRSIDEIDPVSPLASSLAAGFSGALAAAASHSFDTAKTRSQSIVIPKYIAMERKLLRWEAPGNWLERVAGMSPADRNIMFRGLWPRVLCCGISSFVFVGSYLLTVDYLL